MMRLSLTHFARKDMVDMLLRRGRLADIQMLNFFSAQVDSEIAASAAATTPAAPEASATSAAPTESVEQGITRIAQEAKKSVFDKFTQQCAKVRTQAMTTGPMSWMADVYGSEEWSTSHLSYKTLKAAFVPGSNQRRVTVTGQTMAAGGGASAGKLPDRVQMVVRIPRQSSEKAKNENAAQVLGAVPEFVVLSVQLNQGPGKVDARTVNGLLQLRFTDAVGEVVLDNATFTSSKGEPLETLYRDPAQIAARQHVLTAAAYAGLLAKIEEVVALHITAASQYDGLLVRNNAVQMRLSQLACFRYGVETLTSFVVGDSELDAEDTAYMRKKVLLNYFVNAEKQAAAAAAEASDASTGKDAEQKAESAANPLEDAEAHRTRLAIIRNEQNNLFKLPLFESVVLNIYAENALMDGIDCAWHIVRDYPLTAKVPHRSRPEKLIDYPYLRSIFDVPKYSITSADGSMELQALEFLAPLLSRSGAFSADGKGSVNPVAGAMGSIQQLMGFTTAGRVRLTAPHVNLRVSAQTVEEDLHALLTFVDKERLRSGATGVGSVSPSTKVDPAFVFCASSYLAELFTNVAVLYRCTAALTADEEGLGHREWLLAQCFSAASSARRRKYLTDYQLMQAAAKAVGSEENYATHPVELMNVSPRKKEAGDESGKGSRAAAPAASEGKKSAKSQKSQRA